MFGASIPCGILLFWLFLFLLFLLLFFFLFTGCWLESSVRAFSFFREVFVLFSFKLRSSFAPRRVASCQTIKRFGFCSANSRNWERYVLSIKSGLFAGQNHGFLPAFLWIRTYTGQFAESTIPWTMPDGKVATQKYLAI
jgi:hypothetical protein